MIGAMAVTNLVGSSISRRVRSREIWALADAFGLQQVTALVSHDDLQTRADGEMNEGNERVW